MSIDPTQYNQHIQPPASEPQQTLESLASPRHDQLLQQADECFAHQDYAQAESLYARIISNARQSAEPKPSEIIPALYGHIRSCTFTQKIAAAADSLNEFLKLLEPFGESANSERMWGMHLLCDIYQSLGNNKESTSTIYQALNLCETDKNLQHYLPSCHAKLAYLQLEDGHATQALASMENALRYAKEQGFEKQLEETVRSLCVLADGLRQRMLVDEARDCAGCAYQIAKMIEADDGYELQLGTLKRLYEIENQYGQPKRALSIVGVMKKLASTHDPENNGQLARLRLIELHETAYSGAISDAIETAQTYLNSSQDQNNIRLLHFLSNAYSICGELGKAYEVNRQREEIILKKLPLPIQQALAEATSPTEMIGQYTLTEQREILTNLQFFAQSLKTEIELELQRQNKTKLKELEKALQVVLNAIGYSVDNPEYGLHIESEAAPDERLKALERILENDRPQEPDDEFHLITRYLEECVEHGEIARGYAEYQRAEELFDRLFAGSNSLAHIPLLHRYADRCLDFDNAGRAVEIGEHLRYLFSISTIKSSDLYVKVLTSLSRFYQHLSDSKENEILEQSIEVAHHLRRRTNSFRNEVARRSPQS